MGFWGGPIYLAARLLFSADFGIAIGQEADGSYWTYGIRRLFSGDWEIYVTEGPYSFRPHFPFLINVEPD